MQNRFQIQETTEEFGLVGWLEDTRVRLPLKGIECQFDVRGDLLEVEIDQIFHHSGLKPMDCLYSFPLPSEAAVHRCEMHVNGRVVRAKVEERQKARRIAQVKKAQGFRTTLVEMERDNLFTLSVGNLQPGDVVVIRFAYFQKLTRLQDWTSFSIPFCPGVRYIPGEPLLRSLRGRGVVDDTNQVPDASRISPPRIHSLHPDAAYVHVAGRIDDALGLVRDLSSPSHAVVVTDGESHFGVGIANGAAVPDRDLILKWTEDPAEQLKPVGWVLKEQNENYAMVRLRAPEDFPVEENATGQDVYFLLDRSGSMAGAKWVRTVQAFLSFLKLLGPRDRVWVTLYESRYRDFAETPLPVQEVLEDPAAAKLVALGVQGGTELLPALRHVIDKVRTYSSDRPSTLILITDGQVGNEAELLRLADAAPELRIHTFGIDTVVNDGLLKKLASRHRGSSCLVSPNEDIVGTVSRLGYRLRRPVLTSLSVDEGWEPAREQIPDLHAGETVVLSLKGQDSSGDVVVKGKLANGQTHAFRPVLTAASNAALRLCWARERIDSLLTDGRESEAIGLAKEHNLACEGAAFVAWDESEKVRLSEVEVYQPSQEPFLEMLFCKSAGGLDNTYAGALGADPEMEQFTKQRMRGAGKSALNAPALREETVLLATLFPSWNSELRRRARDQRRAFSVMDVARLRARYENDGSHDQSLMLDLFELLATLLLMASDGSQVAFQQFARAMDAIRSRLEKRDGAERVLLERLREPLTALVESVKRPPLSQRKTLPAAQDGWQRGLELMKNVCGPAVRG